MCRQFFCISTAGGGIDQIWSWIVKSGAYMHAHAIIDNACMTIRASMWGGRRRGGPAAAGWWEGLTAPAEQPAALCRWISLPRKSAQENRFALLESGQTPEVTSWFVSHNPNDLVFLIARQALVEFLTKRWGRTFKMLLSSKLAHWVGGYIRSVLFNLLNIHSIIMQPCDNVHGWMNTAEYEMYVERCV